jgi:hypothetical protein
MIKETILTLITVAAMALLLYKLLKKAKRRRGDDSAAVILWWLIVLVSGFALYLYAALQIPKAETQDLISYLLSSIALSAKSAIKMFGFDFYYGEVKHVANNSIPYSVAITVCYFAAILWTTLMAKNLFFPGITNGVKVWLRANLPQGKNGCHYIIVGCEKSMRVFLENMRGGNVKKKNITIITGIPLKNGASSTAYFKDFIEDGYAVIRGKADEAALVRAGVGNVGRRARVIAITECDKQNLAVADIITQKISSAVKSHPDAELRYGEAMDSINLEAYIMYSFIERTEHFAFAESAGGKVEFFNPYELRVRDFFWKHPITGFIPHLIDTGKARLAGEFRTDGKIYKPDGHEYTVKHIFVGFGSANYQMLKGSILTGQLLGCDYNATIYDENIREGKPSIRQAMFMNHASGLFGGTETMEGEEYFRSPSEKYKINFKNGNALTRDFYTSANNCLIEEVKGNDFTLIYIALGEDKLSVETACEIRQCLYEHGIEQDNLRIFVKICEESVFNSDLVINNQRNIPIKIECFGLDKSILTQNNIMNESLDGFAKMVTNKNHKTSWARLTETKRDSNRQAAMTIKTMLNLLGFDLAEKWDAEGRVKGEDYYKAYKRGCGSDKISKIIELSMEIAARDAEIESIKKNAAREEVEDAIGELEKKKGERSSYILDYIEQSGGVIGDTPRNNLARLEHLRWNTFHLVHGWTKLPKGRVGAGNSGRQNKLTKQHACITTFEELISLRELQAEKMREKDAALSLEEARSAVDTIWYDYNVMDELPVRLGSDWGIRRRG